METLTHDGRDWALRRWPLRNDDPLRAWDAADAYLLDHLREAPPSGPLLLMEDAFGALATVLHARRPTVWGDSVLSRLALSHNLELNGAPADAATFVPGDHDPEGRFEVAVVKPPKSLAALEDRLLRLRPVLAPGARVVLGSMIKHTPKRVYETLERCIGPTRTGLGRRKARLAFADFDADLDLPPGTPSSEYEAEGMVLTNRPGVFSRERLDPGTRLLLAHLPGGDAPLRAADLGCGNGVLGLALALRRPDAEILLVDASYTAVACARDNAARAGLDGPRLRFAAADGLADEPPGALDLVLCNPPFHQDRSVGDALAWRMFVQARRALRPGGELRLVGNRHLAYHVKLKRIFGNATLVASDRKFVVLSAVTP